MDLAHYDAAAAFRLADAAGGSWYLLHTKSRQEKAVSEAPVARGISHFLPLAGVTRNYGGRKVSLDLPLFPGYLFLKGTKEDVYTADRTKRLANIINVSDQTKMTWELRNLALALSSSVPLNPFSYIRVGVKVEVRSGPLLGLQGIVESRSRRDRLILQVDVLGQAMSLEIDEAILDVIE